MPYSLETLNLDELFVVSDRCNGNETQENLTSSTTFLSDSFLCMSPDEVDIYGTFWLGAKECEMAFGTWCS